MTQECYQDLSPVIIQYEASVYQYVGDEVVLSWPFLKKETDSINSLKTFFTYTDLLKDKEKVYRSRFGLVPEFRGGIDMGTATTIEVVDMKREIVCHGDVLNTAAWLLDLCKERNERLIVSKDIGESVKLHPDFEIN